MSKKMKQAIVAAIVAALAVYGVTVTEEQEQIALDLLEVEQTE